MNTTTPRIGVIGGGVYGTQVLKVLKRAQSFNQIILAAVADLDESVVKAHMKTFSIAGYRDYREMIRKECLDAVAVVTPDHLHEAITIDCVNERLDVLVQKPLHTDQTGARNMIEAARENQALLYVDFHKRFDPAHIGLKESIASGRLGALQYGYVWMEDKITVPSVWFRTWAQHSSPAWFLGIHFYDLVGWLLSARPVRVWATGIKRKLCSMGIDTFDSIQAKVEYESGISFHFDTSWILPESFPSVVNQGLRLIADRGICEIDSQDRGFFMAEESLPNAQVLNPFGYMENAHVPHATGPTGYTADSILYFVTLLQKRKQGAHLGDIKGLYPDGEQALISTLLCEAVHTSIQRQEPVDL